MVKRLEVKRNDCRNERSQRFIRDQRNCRVFWNPPKDPKETGRRERKRAKRGPQKKYGVFEKKIIVVTFKTGDNQKL
jgi:hypothetical protein